MGHCGSCIGGAIVVGIVGVAAVVSMHGRVAGAAALAVMLWLILTSQIHASVVTIICREIHTARARDALRLGCCGVLAYCGSNIAVVHVDVLVI